MEETVRPRKKLRNDRIGDLADVSGEEDDPEEMPEEVRGWKVEKIRLEAVSYTHLTLPTILLV